MLSIVVALDDLLMSVVASAVAAIAVTIVVSIGIWGATKYVDYHQEGRMAAAWSSLFVGGLGLLLTVAIIIAGIGLMVAG